MCSNYKAEKQDTHDVNTTVKAENKGALKETHELLVLLGLYFIAP